MSAWIIFNYIDVSLICAAMNTTKSFPNLNFFPMLLKDSSLIIFNLKLQFSTATHDCTSISLALKKSDYLESFICICKSWMALFCYLELITFMNANVNDIKRKFWNGINGIRKYFKIACIIHCFFWYLLPSEIVYWWKGQHSVGMMC